MLMLDMLPAPVGPWAGIVVDGWSGGRTLRSPRYTGGYRRLTTPDAAIPNMKGGTSLARISSMRGQGDQYSAEVGERGRIARLEDERQQLHGRPPTADELDRLLSRRRIRLLPTQSSTQSSQEGSRQLLLQLAGRKR